MYKMSEQRVNPKELSVAQSENFQKWQKILYREMSAPRPAARQIPAPRATAWMQKPQGGDKFLVHIHGGARGNGYG